MNGKQIHAMSKGYLAALTFIVVATVLAELNAGFKSFLATTFSHHWVGKSILSIILFVLVYYYYSTHKGNANMHVDAIRMSKQTIIFTLLGALIIFAFYVWEFIKG